MKSLFLAGQIPPRRDCKFNDKSTVVLLPFRSRDENSSRLFRRWSLTPKCLLVLALLGCLLLTSCKGGGGSMTAGGGIDGTGIMSSGAVSAFGSIVVNGTEFDTTEAVIIINGEEIGVGDDVVLDNLDIGKVVTVEGRISKDGRAVADRVIYRANVNGLVESVGGTNPITNEKEIEVLGQIVVVNFITKFKSDMFDTFGFDSIAPNDVVEVSGYFDDTGAIRATFIEKTAEFSSGIVVEVEGYVVNLDIFRKTFEINNLTVDYSLADTSGLPGGQLANDMFAEVEGILNTPAGELIATKIELADELGGEDGDEFEIIGFVTEIISTIDIIKFKIGNQEVHVDPDFIVFVDGNANDIFLGAKLEAEGSLEGGILLADEIEFWEPDQIEVEGIVNEVVFIGNFPDFTFEDRQDQIVQTSGETKFENVAKEKIGAGMKLEVKGVPQDIDQSVIEADKVSLEED